MIKVLSVGDGHKYVEKHRYITQCECCDSKFEFCDDDTHTDFMDDGWGGVQRYVKCPVCNRKVYEGVKWKLVDTFLVEKPLTLFERIKNFFKKKEKQKLLK